MIEDIKAYQDADFIVAISNAKIREQIQKQIENTVYVITLIHPNVVGYDDIIIESGIVSHGRCCYQFERNHWKWMYHKYLFFSRL